MIMFQRFLDLFVTFTKPNGLIEHRLLYVIVNNISLKFFLEIFISIGPWFIHYNSKITAHYYALFKVARYAGIFELDTHINYYIES